MRTPPRALYIVPPQYPNAALAQALRGSVTVGFVIGRDGQTGSVHVISSTPPGVFDRAALQAARQWRFRPATVNGSPVPTPATETLIFNPPLQRQAVPSPPPPAAPAKLKPVTPKPAAAKRPANKLQALSIVPPDYPPTAYRDGICGSVTVQFTVGSDGKPSHIRVLAAHPRGIFNNAAVQAVRHWRFQPVQTPMQVVQTIHFTPPG